jgi:hypothetical protein
MPDFIHGLDLCEAFFRECAKLIIERHYPGLRYSAGALGYGSDVLGYDDAVSTDHMWGPRFYLFLCEGDIHLKDALMSLFGAELPYTFMGYNVSFSDPDSVGVRQGVPITSGAVSPLIWIHTIDEYISEYLGGLPQANAEWLAASEHRLLGFTRGRLFADALGLAEIRARLAFYPEDVRLYLIASQWAVISEEQAFVKRCGDRGDDLGSRIICSRIAERLMRLCFLYCGTYAPYSKWLGTAFKRLPIDTAINTALEAALSANSVQEREKRTVAAQALVAALHNATYSGDNFEIRVQKYYGRDIDVIFCDALAELVRGKISDPALRELPLFGSLSQIGNLVALSDDPAYRGKLEGLYE